MLITVCLLSRLLLWPSRRCHRAYNKAGGHGDDAKGHQPYVCLAVLDAEVVHHLLEGKTAPVALRDPGQEQDGDKDPDEAPSEAPSSPGPARAFAYGRHGCVGRRELWICCHLESVLSDPPSCTPCPRRSELRANDEGVFSHFLPDDGARSGAYGLARASSCGHYGRLGEGCWYSS